MTSSYDEDKNRYKTSTPILTFGNIASCDVNKVTPFLLPKETPYLITTNGEDLYRPPSTSITETLNRFYAIPTPPTLSGTHKVLIEASTQTAHVSDTMVHGAE